MNLPTKLTVVRMFLIPVFVALYFVPFTGHYIAALAVFALASFTDFLDGYIARKYNLVTNLGKFLDPIADKMLVSSALFALVLMPTTDCYQMVIAICSMVIMARELMISGFRIIASSKNVVLAADMLGKIKTVTQMAAIMVLLVACHLLEVEIAAFVVLIVGVVLLAISAILAIVSGFNYVLKNREVLKD